MVTRASYYNNNNYYNYNTNNSPSHGTKTKTDRLRRRVSKVIREANRRNDDPTNNHYTFDRTNKRVLAKQLNTVLRDLNEEVRALKKARKPTSRRRKLAYVAGGLAVAGGIYYAQANLILSALPKIAEVAKGVYPASSKALAFLKSVPKVIASSSKSVAIKNKAKVTFNAVRAVVGSRVTGAALTGKALYNTYVPNGVKARARTGAKATKNYLAPYLAKLRRSKPQTRYSMLAAAK